MHNKKAVGGRVLDVETNKAVFPSTYTSDLRAVAPSRPGGGGGWRGATGSLLAPPLL